MPRTVTGRSARTRELILAAAERLFAEHGAEGVSDRRLSDAASQGDNTAVNHHFGLWLAPVSPAPHGRGRP